MATDDSGVAAAVRGLARFHLALKRMPPSPRQSIPSFQAAASRLAEAKHTAVTPINEGVLVRWPELAGVVGRLPAAISRAEKLGMLFEPWPNSTQPVHGDARPEHFLVESDALVGLIDFDAMRNDSPLADLARFAGEVARGDRERLQAIVRHYEEAIGESIDHRAVQALDLVAAAFSASNWVGWLSDAESSKGYDPELVRGRLASIYARLGA